MEPSCSTEIDRANKRISSRVLVFLLILFEKRNSCNTEGRFRGAKTQYINPAAGGQDHRVIESEPGLSVGLGKLVQLPFYPLEEPLLIDFKSTMHVD